MNMAENILVAKEGKVLTDGKIYVKKIYLADDVSSDAFYEITDAEYERIMEEQMKEEQMMGENIDHIVAENADMKAALNLLGVE